MASGFESFSAEHLTTLLAFGMITYVAIRKGKVAEEPVKSNIGLMIAGLAFSTLLIEAIVKLAYGSFDMLVDLPFFMCDLVAMILPFIILSGNRKWIGILYFWALAGTMQALITPDVETGFPSFDFFRYFIGHATIIIAVLYTVIVKKIRIGWQDFLNAIIYAQGYLVAVHMINQILSSNYGYTMQKPPGPSILDLMGPWPWYILWGEFLMVFLYLLLLAPFLLWPAKPAPLSQDKESAEDY
jgi:hypothetical integral membrane protein (TIGR02206 family)